VLKGLIVDYGGVLTDLGPDGDSPNLIEALIVARRHELRTGLLSNADRLDPSLAPLAAMFDAIVLSGEAGFGKPDARSYLLVARRIGLAPQECVFVDDLAVNVRGAAEVGMVGVHHKDVESTLAELAILFGFSFAELDQDTVDQNIGEG
jgi:epoxide hydrolase-like predicted phosphatase